MIQFDIENRQVNSIPFKSVNDFYCVHNSKLIFKTAHFSTKIRCFFKKLSDFVLTFVVKKTLMEIEGEDASMAVSFWNKNRAQSVVRLWHISTDCPTKK